MAEHRVELVQGFGALPQLVRRHVHGRGDFGDFSFRLRQEFVQRRIEQADRHRQAGHDLEQFEEIRALHRQQLVERSAPVLLGVGQDHLAHGDDALAVEEHVLGAAKTDAFGAEGARHARIGGRLGIGAHLHAARRVGPFHDRGEIAGQFRLQHRHRALQHLAVAAIDGDDVALAEGLCPSPSACRSCSRRAASRRRTRRACPCRAPPPRRGWSCRRAWSGCLPRHACRGCLPGWSRCGPGSPCGLAPSASSASSEEKTISPVAAPGEAGRPIADHVARGLRIDGRMQQLVERGRDRCAAPPPPG